MMPAAHGEPARTLRAVFVNHCHPETPHVCAVRVREFARAMAARGHHVLVVTETLRRDDAGDDPATLSRRIAGHDWRAPLFVACRPRGHPLLEPLRRGALPRPIGRIVVAAYYATIGSVFADWGRGADPLRGTIAADFRPDVVWTNFGNTECLRIARKISGDARAPWVLDFKDYWSTFIPSPFRRWLGRRCAGAAAATALSAGHFDDVAPFVPLPDGRSVIHSGVPDGFTGGAGDRPAGEHILITGAIYDRDALDALLAGIARWRGDGTSAGIPLAYAGDQGALVAERARAFPAAGEVVDHGYLPLEDLHALQCRAFANAFVRSGPGWFQHKLPELLAAGRPLICLPGAGPESTALAGVAEVPLHNCGSADDVVQALVAISRSAPPIPNRQVLGGFSWSARAVQLERALSKACA